MIYDVDRIENNYAVCYDEDNNKEDISLSMFPFEVKEGDKIKVLEDRIIKLDNSKKKEEIKNLFESLIVKND